MEEKLVNIIEAISDSNKVESYDTDLFSADVLDSFAIAQLISEIEDNFGIEVDPEDIIPENFDTINHIAELLKKYGD